MHIRSAVLIFVGLGLTACLPGLAGAAEDSTAATSKNAGQAWRGEDSTSSLVISDVLRQQTSRWLKQQFRNGVTKLFGRSATATKYGLKLDSDWQKTPLDRGLVVLVHGYQSSPEEHGSILDEVRKVGIPCAFLRYPNDQPIDKSAALLAHELAQIRKVQPQRQLTILGLSMGGLVTRAVIEDAKLDPGNVRRLIMVATPNQGSNLTRFAVASDIWEYLVKSQEQGAFKRVLALWDDGLGEAAEDLTPGSQFLTQLNRRKRNASVEYSIFLGTGGPLSEMSLATLRRFILEQGDRNRVTRALSQKAVSLLEDVDEVVEGKGDGGVAVDRGRLAGVKDVVVLRFGHAKLMDGDNEGARRLREEVLTRIHGERPYGERGASAP